MDFRELVEPYRQQLIEDTIALIKIPSKKGIVKKGAPFGEINKKALDFMLNKGRNEGWKVQEYDGYAGRFEIGNGKKTIGVICHLDVVPEQEEGWIYPPYEGIIEKQVLYGRGANDDKGPTMAVFYALKALLDHGYLPKQKLHLIFGCDEEGNMECMDYYKAHCDRIPDYGFVPDGTFPMNYGEHGLYALQIHMPMPSDVHFVSGGEHPHIVCSHIKASVNHTQNNEELYSFFLKTKELKGNMQTLQEEVVFSMEGVPAHGSRPFLGRNAASNMFCYLGHAYGIQSFQLLSHLLSNWQGIPLGIQCRDMKYGELSLCITQVETIAKELVVTVDIRYPYHLDKNKLRQDFEKNVMQIEGSYVSVLEDRDGHYTDPNSGMVKALEHIYRNQSKDDKTPIKVSPGDTYARKFENFVAYGPTTKQHLQMPHIGQAHQCNEGMDIETLMQGCAIYVEALAYLLGGEFTQ